MNRASISKLLFVLLSATAIAGKPASPPVSVGIVGVPHDKRGEGQGIGNVKVRFADGHTEIWDKSGKCMNARVTKKGHVGWEVVCGYNDYNEAINCSVHIRFPSGTIREYECCPARLFIVRWAFTDHYKSVVIESMGRHGPSHFIKYDAATGEQTGLVDVSTEFANLPKWAQIFGDN